MPAYSLKLVPATANVSYFSFTPTDPTERYTNYGGSLVPELSIDPVTGNQAKISFSDIAKEFCQDTVTNATLSSCNGGESGIPQARAGQPIKFSDYYGTEFKLLATCLLGSTAANLPGSLYTQEQLNRPNAKKITIPSTTNILSSTTAPAANIKFNWKGRVIIDNYGLIVGKGGTAGSVNGGPALRIDTAQTIGNVTIRNYGQILAGGGKGGVGGKGGDGEYYVTNPVATSTTQFGTTTNYKTFNAYTRTGQWAYNGAFTLNEAATTGTLIRINLTAALDTDARIAAAISSGYWYSYSKAQDHWYSVNGITGLYLRIVADATGLTADTDYAPRYRGRHIQLVLSAENTGSGYYVSGFTGSALSGSRLNGGSFYSSTTAAPTSRTGQISGTRRTYGTTSTTDGRLSVGSVNAWGAWDAGLHQPGQANFPTNRWTGGGISAGVSSWSLSLATKTTIIASASLGTDFFFGVNTSSSNWGITYPAVDYNNGTYYGYVGTYDSGGTLFNGLGSILRTQNTAPTFTLTKSIGGAGGAGGDGQGGGGVYSSTGAVGSAGGTNAGSGGTGGGGGTYGNSGGSGLLGSNGTIITGALTNGVRGVVGIGGAGGNSVISLGSYQSNVHILNLGGNFLGKSLIPAGSYGTPPWTANTSTSGLTTYTMSPDSNNGGVMLTLGFNITMSGQTFDRVYFGTNGYISFHNAAAPTGSNVTNPTPTNPGRFGILFWPGDRTVSNFKAGRIGAFATYVMSFEMASSTVAGETAFFEIRINGNINTVNVLMNTGERFQTQVAGGISDGISYSGFCLYPIYIGGYTSGYMYVLPQ